MKHYRTGGTVEIMTLNILGYFLETSSEKKYLMVALLKTMIVKQGLLVEFQTDHAWIFEGVERTRGYSR